MEYNEFEDIPNKSIKPDTFKGKITKIKKISENVFSLKFKLDHKMNFQPGQYVLVEKLIDNKKYLRGYTLTSTPDDENIELTVLRTDESLVSDFITDKNKGDTIEFKGPYGNFVIDNQNKDLFFLAVDIAINPYISMLRYLYRHDFSRKIFLSYIWTLDTTPIYNEYLLKLNKYMDNFNLNFLLVDKDDFKIIKKSVNELILNPEKYSIYICGERAITDNIINYLEENGFHNENMHIEQWY